MNTQEAKSYLTPFDPGKHPVFWFNNFFPANTWSKPHSHPWGELAYVSHGSIVICTASGNWLSPMQRAVWIPPGCEHSWYAPSNMRDCSLWIDHNILLCLERFKHCHVMELSPLLREMLLYLCPQPCSYGDDANGHLVVALLDQILDQPLVREPLAMPRDHRLVELCTALLTMPGDDISLVQWANRLGMSERNLARLFHRETGKSFRTWRQLQRMQCAHNKLRQGESVTSVAIDCGYSSLSAFIACFKKTFGFTPGKAALEQ